MGKGSTNRLGKVRQFELAVGQEVEHLGGGGSWEEGVSSGQREHLLEVSIPARAQEDAWCEVGSFRKSSLACCRKTLSSIAAEPKAEGEREGDSSTGGR